MARCACLTFSFLIATQCLAQETTIVDVKRDLAQAREKLDQVVVFCDWCDGAGKLDGKKCSHCEGLGAMLIPESKHLAHKRSLEKQAVRKGRPKSDYAAFDIADRLTAFEKQYDEEAFKALAAYVDYLKVCRQYADLIKADEKVSADTRRVIDGMERIVARYGRRLRVASMKMLYEQHASEKDSTGDSSGYSSGYSSGDSSPEVGTFVLYGKKGVVKIDGQEAELYRIRTLKDCAILVKTAGAAKRKGFLLAEIIGKDTYTTDAGKEIKAILMQAY